MITSSKNERRPGRARPARPRGALGAPVAPNAQPQGAMPLASRPRRSGRARARARTAGRVPRAALALLLALAPSGAHTAAPCTRRIEAGTNCADEGLRAPTAGECEAYAKTNHFVFSMLVPADTPAGACLLINQASLPENEPPDALFVDLKALEPCPPSFECLCHALSDAPCEQDSAELSAPAPGALPSAAAAPTTDGQEAAGAEPEAAAGADAAARLGAWLKTSFLKPYSAKDKVKPEL